MRILVVAPSRVTVVLTLVACAAGLLWLIWLGALLLLGRRPELKVGALGDFVFPSAAGLVVAGWLAAPAGTALARFLDGYLLYGAIIFGLMLLVWALSLLLRDASIMDVAYPLAAFVPLAVLVALRGIWSAHEIVVLLLVALWSLRLSSHIGRRNLGHGEDARYAGWRRRFGHRWWWWSLFQVFLLQGVLVWLWCLPLALALDAAPAGLSWHHAAAIGVFAVGFVFQAVGDWQLARFMRTRTDRTAVLDTGLWRLTRHPNYFGEATIWWSFWLAVLVHPWGWLSFPAPLHVTWFMSRGSAAPMQERYLMKTKPAYADYMRRVPAFIPWGRAGP
jgi:steroid 5-alpha reductase family enzyme